MYSELSSEQARQIIDSRQMYAALRNAENELRTRYKGSISWKNIGGVDYLYRKTKGSWKSLGARNADTEKIYATFVSGRDQQKKIKKEIHDRLKKMAPVNKALRINRVPLIAARILARLDKVGLLGKDVVVIGTNAMFVYESEAGIQFSSELIATGDIDLLYDARRHLKLFTSRDAAKGLLDIIKKVDSSFTIQPRGFRATNKDGYLVDLVTPVAGDRMRDDQLLAVGNKDKDLVAIPIDGLIWLENSPKMESVVIGEDGMPIRMVSPDPRVFAAHKLWVAEREDREPIKRGRDKEQAEVLIKDILPRFPRLKLDGSDLSALPGGMREKLLAYQAPGEAALKVTESNEAAAAAGEISTWPEERLRASYAATGMALSGGTSSSPEAALGLLEMKAGMEILSREMKRRGLDVAPTSTQAPGKRKNQGREM